MEDSETSYSVNPEIPDEVFEVVGPGERVGLDLAEPMGKMAAQVAILAKLQAEMIERLAVLEAKIK